MSSSDVVGTRASISNSVPELVAGLAVIILTILGLAGVSPVFLVAIATIVFEVSLLLYGSSAIGEIKRAPRRSDDFDTLTRAAIGGLPILFVVGVAGIVLGILALLGISALELIAIAVIAFGGSLILSSNARARTGQLGGLTAGSDQAPSHIVDEAASDAAGMQTIVGLSAVVLGILALANFAQVTLVLVALLALGCLVVLSSAAFSGSLMRAFTAG